MTKTPLHVTAAVGCLLLAVSTSARGADDGGFNSLFNGRDLSEWTFGGEPPSRSPSVMAYCKFNFARSKSRKSWIRCPMSAGEAEDVRVGRPRESIKEACRSCPVFRWL